MITIKPQELESLRQHAAKRSNIHIGQSTRRALSNDYELVGLMGELAFEKWSGLPMDRQLKPGGDSKIDFVVPTGITIDVKSYVKAFNLFREIKRPHADILVLALVEMQKAAVYLRGWEYSVLMAYQPYKDFGYGVINHYKHYSNLRPMDKLKEWIYWNPFEEIDSG